MNSFELVLRTFNFEHPERVAHSFYPSDIVWVGVHSPTHRNGWRRTGEREWQRTDEWGNVWKKTNSTARGTIARGGLQHLKDAASHPFPDFKNQSFYSDVKAAFSINPDKWHIGLLSGSTFEIANSLLDHYLSDLLLYRDGIRFLHDRIDKLLLDQIAGFKEAGAHAVMIIEDLGDTAQIPMGPGLWRDEFKDRLTALCNHAHHLGLKFAIHTAQESALIPELLGTGVDCIQLDNPELYGLDTLELLRKKYNTTFWCPVDIHGTLQTKNEKLIRAEARELLDRLWKGEGGFIAGYYFDNPGLGLHPQWQQYACDEFLKYGTQEWYQSTLPDRNPH